MLRITTLVTLILLTNCAKKTGKERVAKEFTQEQYERHYQLKLKGLESLLGKMHDIVGHAIIPFEVGGSVDMYYFPNGITGTGFATMELVQPDGTGPLPNRNGTYELVSFTRLHYTSDTTETNPFNLIERRICGTFTATGNYSFGATLEPGETMEIPEGEQPAKYIVFDEYRPENKQFAIGDERHGLLLVIEVFKEEMEYAMTNGSGSLLEMLKAKGYYPYSDLDRGSVLK